MRTAAFFPILAAALLGAPAAFAQGADPAAAQGLFDAAKQLAAAGRFAEACPKFLASLRLDSKPGTAVNLADCYEKTGRVASSWARYLEAASLAQHAGQAEREQYARAHAAALEPKLARLTVSAAPGLEVLRDGELMDAAILGTPVPVDPGQHVIEARATGKKPWKKTVDIHATAERIVVEIPALENAAQVEPAAPPPSRDATPPAAPPAQDMGPSPDQPGGSPSSTRGAGSLRRPVGFAALAIGGAGIVAGAITGGLAIGKHESLAAACTKGVCVGQDSTISSYHTLGTVSDVGLFVGGAIAVTGLVLVVTAPRATPAKQAWVTPIVGPGFVGAAGSF